MKQPFTKIAAVLVGLGLLAVLTNQAGWRGAAKIGPFDAAPLAPVVAALGGMGALKWRDLLAVLQTLLRKLVGAGDAVVSTINPAEHQRLSDTSEAHTKEITQLKSEIVTLTKRVKSLESK